jgi:hypothetical protein
VSDQPTLGGKIGGRVASLTSAAVVRTRQQLAPHTVNVVMQAQDAFFRLVGSEIRKTLGEPLGRLADTKAAPGWVRDTFGFLARSHGQWQAFLAQSVAGQALGVGLGQLLTNELTPAIAELILDNPNSLLSPDTVAALAARGKMPVADADIEARKQGVDAGRFRLLMGGAQHDLAAGDALDAVRRGLMDASNLRRALRDGGFSDAAIGILERFVNVPLQATDAANMVQRGILTHAQGESVALETGVTPEDFGRLVNLTGNPLSVQDLLFLFRRGKINRARLEEGIRQGDTKNEWIPENEMLGTAPMSTSDAIAAAVQNHLSIAAAKQIAVENGLEPDHFQPLLDTAGSPLSPTEMLDLWNRGEATQSDVEQALREGRLKDKYIPFLLKLREYILPPDTIRLMYEKGVIDGPTAATKLRARGLSSDDVQLYLSFAQTAKMATSRDLTESIVRQLYADQAISHSVALTNLKHLGYDATEAEQILSISDLQRNQRMLDSAISRVHARFIAHRIAENDAITALDALHVPPAQRDAFIDTWNVERDLNVPTLTVSQIGQALKKQFITPADAFDRLTRMGYDDTDATLILGLYGVPIEGG